MVECQQMWIQKIFSIFPINADVYFIGLSLILGPLSSKNRIVQKNMRAEKAQYKFKMTLHIH